LSGSQDPPAAAARHAGERLEPARRARGRKRREDPLESSKDDLPRQKR
jgi:hypothetical protein